MEKGELLFPQIPFRLRGHNTKCVHILLYLLQVGPAPLLASQAGEKSSRKRGGRRSLPLFPSNLPLLHSPVHTGRRGGGTPAACLHLLSGDHGPAGGGKGASKPPPQSPPLSSSSRAEGEKGVWKERVGGATAVEWGSKQQWISRHRVARGDTGGRKRGGGGRLFFFEAAEQTAELGGGSISREIKVLPLSSDRL